MFEVVVIYANVCLYMENRAQSDNCQINNNDNLQRIFWKISLVKISITLSKLGQIMMFLDSHHVTSISH